jgi:rhamnosyltransferase
MTVSILILMATYNGERFLREQLTSLIAQTDKDWKLLARDDGSSDQTLDILSQAASVDKRIEILPGNNERIGPAGNFAKLLEAAGKRQAEYFALCDQDDTWQPDKLQKQLSSLRAMEDRVGKECPLMVHSDLEVTDRNMQTLHMSFMRFQLIKCPATTNPLTLVAQNHVVGCTMLFNRSLLTLAQPFPNSVHMHDWWLALCVEFAGVRQYLPQPLVRYRQHDRNEVGAQGLERRLAKPWAVPIWLRKIWYINNQTWYQAEELLRRLEREMNQVNTHPLCETKLLELRRFVAVRNLGGISRIKKLWHMGLRCQNPLMTALYYLRALFPLALRTKREVD